MVVTIDNSFSYVSKHFEALPQKIKNKFVKELSYEKKTGLRQTEEFYLFQKNPSPIANFSTYNMVPTGLLVKFHQLCKQYGIKNQYVDIRGPKPKHIDPKEFLQNLKETAPEIEERDYQISGLEKCLKYKRGLIEHSTGAGKTIIIAGIAYCCNCKTLILCVKKDQLFQLKNDIERILGFSISVYGAGQKDLSRDVVIGMVDTFHAMYKSDKARYKRILSLFKCVIGDEIHFSGSQSYKQIWYYAKNARWRFGFSGTMHREDGAFLEVIGAVGPILDKVDYGYLEKNNYISKARFFFIDPHCEYLDEEEDYWPNCLTNGIVSNEQRNKWLKKICGIYTQKNKQVLLITPFRVRHGLQLAKRIPNSRYVYGQSNNESRKKALEDFRNKDFMVLISSNVLDVAINIPDVRAVVLAGGGKAHNSFFQRVGRGIRKAAGKNYVDVIIPWDSHSRILYRHSKKIVSYIKKISTWKNNIRFVGEIRSR